MHKHIALLLIICGARDVDSWPEGTYGLPMPKNGCPQADFAWEIGSRTQQTEQGSYGSERIHLAGISEVRSDVIVQNFCMKTSFPAYGEFTWGEGQYCLFKKDRCPLGFEEGSIYWDDAAPFVGGTVQSFSGVLPEGIYDRNTKISYCCRDDGPVSKALQVPNTSPFYLIKMGASCQEVFGMKVTEEFVYWSDESTLNFDAMWGMYPRLQRSKYPSKYTMLYYCYYEPQAVRVPSSTPVYVLLGLVALVVGSVLLSFVLCVANRVVVLYRRRHTQRSLSAQTTDTSDGGQGSPSPQLFASAPPKYSVVDTRGERDEDSDISDRQPIMEALVQPPSYAEAISSNSEARRLSNV